jgi:hypothetical protein
LTFRPPYGLAGVNDDTAFDGRLDVYYDSLIEVIDPRSRSVIARHRMDAYASAFTTRGKLVIYGEDRGEPYLDVVPLTLQTGR